MQMTDGLNLHLRNCSQIAIDNFRGTGKARLRCPDGSVLLSGGMSNRVQKLGGDQLLSHGLACPSPLVADVTAAPLRSRLGVHGVLPGGGTDLPLRCVASYQHHKQSEHWATLNIELKTDTRTGLVITTAAAWTRTRTSVALPCAPHQSHKRRETTTCLSAVNHVRVPAEHHCSVVACSD